MEFSLTTKNQAYSLGVFVSSRVLFVTQNGPVSSGWILSRARERLGRNEERTEHWWIRCGEWVACTLILSKNPEFLKNVGPFHSSHQLSLPLCSKWEGDVDHELRSTNKMDDLRSPRSLPLFRFPDLRQLACRRVRRLNRRSLARRDNTDIYRPS